MNFATIKKAFEQISNNNKLEIKNHFYLERGSYVIASVMDESTSSTSLVLQGTFIDLFDPELPVLKKKTIDPDQQAFLYDVSKIQDKNKPQVLCGASRIYDEKIANTSYSFVAKSPLNTNNVSRVYTPQKSKTILVKNAVGGQKVVASNSWDEASKTSLVKFENNPDGISVEIKW